MSKSKAAPKSATATLSNADKAKARSESAKKAAATRAAKKAQAATPSGKSGVELMVERLDGLDGKNVELQVSGSMNLTGGGVTMPEFFTGTLRAHDTKNGERRWKVGRRVVSLSTIASVEAIEAPAKPEPTPAAKPADTTPAPVAVSIDDQAKKAVDALPAHIVNYVEQHASQDAMAPMHGLPFVQAGRLYVQLEGRGGAGRGDTVAETTGLRPFLRATNGGLGEAPKKVLQIALATLGFERAPFPYVHPDRGSTASSYYSIELAAFKADIVVEPRQGKRDAARAEKVVATPNKSLAEAPVPMNPDGDERDVKRLGELWKAYNDARGAWRNAALKRVSKDKQDEYQAATREANADLVAHRRMMHTKNVQAAAKA